ILLAPHFVGLDAGGTRLTLDRQCISLFANQKNKVFNAAMREGRSRFNDAVLLSRQEGLRTAIRMMHEGVPFYSPPDMASGPRYSVYVPLFGVPAATGTSGARMAQMTTAVVIPCVTEMTDGGCLARLYPPWADYPGDDLVAATERM